MLNNRITKNEEKSSSEAENLLQRIKMLEHRLKQYGDDLVAKKY